MSNIEKRLEKLEAKVQTMEKEINARKANLKEIQRLEKDNPIKAALFQRELETGRKYTLALLFSELVDLEEQE